MQVQKFHLAFPAKNLIFSERKRHFEIDKYKRTGITLNYLEFQLLIIL